MLQTMLQASAHATALGRYQCALNYLSEARSLARAFQHKHKGNKYQVIATQCTVAMHALLPLSIEEAWMYQDFPSNLDMDLS